MPFAYQYFFNERLVAFILALKGRIKERDVLTCGAVVKKTARNLSVVTQYTAYRAAGCVEVHATS